jgi:hypothetical protein
LDTLSAEVVVLVAMKAFMSDGENLGPKVIAEALIDVAFSATADALSIGTQSAQSIRASGQTCRINRPDT